MTGTEEKHLALQKKINNAISADTAFITLGDGSVLGAVIRGPDVIPALGLFKLRKPYDIGVRQDISPDDVSKAFAIIRIPTHEALAVFRFWLDDIEQALRKETDQGKAEDDGA